MDEVEVDPKLFVMCRLCLDEIGLFQIQPSTKDRIKFCFDIQVELFDGLPQLICRNCKNTLIKYHDVKSSFIEKQQTLKSKFIEKKKPPQYHKKKPNTQQKRVNHYSNTQKCDSSQQGTVSSSQEESNETKHKSEELIQTADKSRKNSNVQISGNTLQDIGENKATSQKSEDLIETADKSRKSSNVQISGNTLQDMGENKATSQKLVYLFETADKSRKRSNVQISGNTLQDKGENKATSQKPEDLIESADKSRKSSNVQISGNTLQDMGENKATSQKSEDLIVTADKSRKRSNMQISGNTLQDMGENKVTSQKSEELVETADKSRKRSNMQISANPLETLNENKATTKTLTPVKEMENNTEHIDNNALPTSTDLNRQYVCKLCSKCFLLKDSAVKHCKRKHKKLIAKHQNIFKRYCTVSLNKIDNKLNITGSLSTVVHDSTRMISHGGSAQYYTKYYSSISPNSESDEDSCFKHGFTKRKRLRALSRSSSETVVLDARSMSSNGCENEEKNQDDCIQIDDSSDSESAKTDLSTAEYKFTAVDRKNLRHTVSTTNNKFLKKKKAQETDCTPYSETQLKHKILNMGRKILNKLGFNCTGLFRYMEHKHLVITWTLPSTVSSGNSGSNYVHIMPKLRGKESNQDRWNILPESSVDDSSMESVSDFETDNAMIFESESSIEHTGIIEAQAETEIFKAQAGKEIAKAQAETEIAKAQAETEIFKAPAVLHQNLKDDPHKNKLLNLSPVPNPKQLPKKTHLTESKVNLKRSESETCQEEIHMETENNSMSLYIENNNENNGVLLMPIITSTASMAVPSAEEKVSEPPVKNVIPQKSTPRIKVKPASELMSESVLKNLAQPQYGAPTSIWGFNNMNTNTTMNGTSLSNNMFVVNESVQSLAPTVQLHVTAVQPHASAVHTFAPAIQSVAPAVQSQAAAVHTFAPAVISQVPAVQSSASAVKSFTPALQSCAPAVLQSNMQPNPTRGIVAHNSNDMRSNKNGEMVILNTAELPNTKTDSPFKYFRQLLHMHRIYLLDPLDTAPSNFNCLIKFKLQYKQETVDHPVVIYINLLASDNKYYLGLKHNDELSGINIYDLPSHWQWEILTKLNSNPVIKKALRNAEKIETGVFDRTKKFFCLLKSIQYSKIDS